jgi:hypothetical protein
LYADKVAQVLFSSSDILVQAIPTGWFLLFFGSSAIDDLHWLLARFVWTAMFYPMPNI